MPYKLFFLLIILYSASSLQYNQNLAIKYWNHCATSYCFPNFIQNWNCGVPCASYPNIKNIQVFSNDNTHLQGFAGYDVDEQAITVVFRGTDGSNIQNWLANLNIIQVPYARCQGCYIHQGFDYDYSSIKDQALASALALRNQYPTAKVNVIGHSMGAVLGVLLAVDLQLLNIEINSIYTYGSPRIGDSKFALFVNNLFPGKIFRQTHKNDPVPHNPSYYFGFQHVGQEVFYSDDTLKYVICAESEDRTCIWSYAGYNVTDHFLYMSVNIHTLEATCKTSSRRFLN